VYRIDWRLKDKTTGSSEFKDRDEAVSCWNNLLLSPHVTRVQVWDWESVKGYWRLLKTASDGEPELSADKITD